MTTSAIHGRTRSRRGPVVVLVLAILALLGSIAAVTRPMWNGTAATATGSGWSGANGYAGTGMMDGGQAMGPGMMGGRVWATGDGVPVTGIPAARGRADRVVKSAGLHSGEVIQFTGNFYVELKNAAGQSVTEVLVDPATGAVSTEPGPAMMWNTGNSSAVVDQDKAKGIAADWLSANRSSESVKTVDAYPGYYTVDTVGADGHLVGMLSVNATTGAVWYHTWHGTFVAEQDA